MTFTELCRYVESSFNPRRYVSVSVEWFCHPSRPGMIRTPALQISIHVGGTVADKSDTVQGDSIAEAKLLFEQRWLRDGADAAVELQHIDITDSTTAELEQELLRQPWPPK